jgi:MSHA biogenesis protein MshP
MNNKNVIQEVNLYEKAKGFILVSAIFILIVLALVATIGVTLSNISRTSSSYSINQSRAYYTAQAGLQWHAALVKTLNNCPSAAYEYPSVGSSWNSGALVYGNGNLKDFYVQVQCAQQGSDITENGQTVRVLNLSAQAFRTVNGRQMFTRRNLNMVVVIQCAIGC